MKFMKTKNLLKILHRRIFNCYDFSISIINDRKKQMISKLWQKICKKYEINNKLSFAHHSKIDEQTKNANKIMKNYLKIYVKYAQNDWMNYFSNVEFAANNHINASTNIISFFAKHEYHFKNETKSFELYEKTITKKTKLMKTNKIVKKQKTMQHYFKKRLMIAQNDQKKHANVNRQSHFEYKIKNMIYVNAKNFTSKRQSKSLNSKNVELWKIIKNIKKKIYELKISKNLKTIELTSIFHSWKLHLTFFDSFSNQILISNFSLLIKFSKNDKKHEKWKLLKIVNCKKTKKKSNTKRPMSIRTKNEMSIRHDNRDQISRIRKMQC